MPRIEIGAELVEIIDCPICGRTVLKESRAAAGFLAPCGRRLINISECGKASDLCHRGADDDETLDAAPHPETDASLRFRLMAEMRKRGQSVAEITDSGVRTAIGLDIDRIAGPFGIFRDGIKKPIPVNRA